MRQAGLALPPSAVTVRCAKRSNSQVNDDFLKGALGFISGFGIIGGAVVPTITGALSSKFEIKVMPVVCVMFRFVRDAFGSSNRR